MTRQEAQAIISKIDADRNRIIATNAAQNEHGDGYEIGYDYTAQLDALAAAGWTAIKGNLYSRDDFESMRAAWNGAIADLK